MTFTEHREAGVVVIRPTGPILGEDSERFGRRLQELLEQAAGLVVVDLTKVGYFDSLGLETLVGAAERMIRSGQTLVLAAANDTVREVLELTESAALFEQYASVDDAVGSLA